MAGIHSINTQQAGNSNRIHSANQSSLERCNMIKLYSKEIEVKMQKLYNCMSENDGCLYAGVEALKLAHEGLIIFPNFLDVRMIQFC